MALRDARRPRRDPVRTRASRAEPAARRGRAQQPRPPTRRGGTQARPVRPARPEARPLNRPSARVPDRAPALRGVTWIESEPGRFWFCASAQREEGSGDDAYGRFAASTTPAASCPMTTTVWATRSHATRASSMPQPGNPRRPRHGAREAPNETSRSAWVSSSTPASTHSRTAARCGCNYDSGRRRTLRRRAIPRRARPARLRRRRSRLVGVARRLAVG